MLCIVPRLFLCTATCLSLLLGLAVRWFAYCLPMMVLTGNNLGCDFFFSPVDSSSTRVGHPSSRTSWKRNLEASLPAFAPAIPVVEHYYPVKEPQSEPRFRPFSTNRSLLPLRTELRAPAT